MRGDGTEHDGSLGETADESYPQGFDTDPTSPGFVPGEEVEIVALDEPSIEDYPPVSDMEPGEHPQDGYIPPDEFGAPPLRPVPVQDGVRDTRNR